MTPISWDPGITLIIISGEGLISRYYPSIQNNFRQPARKEIKKYIGQLLTTIKEIFRCYFPFILTIRLTSIPLYYIFTLHYLKALLPYYFFLPFIISCRRKKLTSNLNIFIQLHFKPLSVICKTFKINLLLAQSIKNDFGKPTLYRVLICIVSKSSVATNMAIVQGKATSVLPDEIEDSAQQKRRVSDQQANLAVKLIPKYILRGSSLRDQSKDKKDKHVGFLELTKIPSNFNKFSPHNSSNNSLATSDASNNHKLTNSSISEYSDPILGESLIVVSDGSNKVNSSQSTKSKIWSKFRLGNKKKTKTSIKTTVGPEIYRHDSKYSNYHNSEHIPLQATREQLSSNGIAASGLQTINLPQTCLKANGSEVLSPPNLISRCCLPLTSADSHADQNVPAKITDVRAQIKHKPPPLSLLPDHQTAVEVIKSPGLKRGSRNSKVSNFSESSDGYNGSSVSSKATFHSCCQRMEPRVSLLGRPLTSCSKCFTKRDLRYRKIQTKIYNFLERPRGWKMMSYHIILFLAVFICLVLSVFATVPQYEKVAGEVLFNMEVVMVAWFIVEHIARIWSAGCRSRYMYLIGRLRFATRPFTLLDFVVIVASLIVLFLGSSGQVFAASALRGLRFFQILRMVRMDRRGGTWKLLGSVVWAHRQELITTLYIGFLGLIFSSFLVYLVEKTENPEKFGTYADALWWGVITLCTVGYGDVVPITWSGKIIASFCALLGISFFALPAGILGSGFALKVQQQQRQKHLNRRRIPAAILIQSLWRCYAADLKSKSTATWKIYLNQVAVINPLAATFTTTSSIFKHNASFVSRFSSKKYRPNHSTVISGPQNSPIHRKHRLAYATDSGINKSNPSLNDFDTSSMSKAIPPEEDHIPVLLKLDNVHKAAIRCIRKMKYFVARRKFKEALKPYDVKDVLEQYSTGHIDLISRVKNLQHRFDTILGKQGSKDKDVYISKISLASRVVKIERQVDDIEQKLDSLMEMFQNTYSLSISAISSQVTPQAPNSRSDSFNLKNAIHGANSYLINPNITSKSSDEQCYLEESDDSGKLKKSSTFTEGMSDVNLSLNKAKQRVRKPTTLSGLDENIKEFKRILLRGDRDRNTGRPSSLKEIIEEPPSTIHTPSDGSPSIAKSLEPQIATKIETASLKQKSCTGMDESSEDSTRKKRIWLSKNKDSWPLQYMDDPT